MRIRTYGELQNGDIITNCGYRFRVRNLRRVAWEPSVIRFEGECIDECDIRGTAYDGGTYGAREDVSCTAERPEVATNGK